MEIVRFLQEMVAKDASDLHIKVGSPPGLRIDGELRPIPGVEPLTPAQCQALIFQILTEEQQQVFQETGDLDLSKGFKGLARFRINVFRERGTCASVLRRIPLEVPVLENMGFPKVIKDLCDKPRGLVLVTGPTGSGKSTTLAAMIDYLNRKEHGHILTLEDPIEFIHQDRNCYVSQREIGSDSRSFLDALRAALREDPDFILVGELRDLETISLAITAAETGHLVFGTLHTTSAIQTIDRIIDVFPHEAQQQVRTQLSVTLQGVISQTLLAKNGGGRCCAQEIMIGTDAVRACVREGKTHQLVNFLQTGSQYGMQTLEAHLAHLAKERTITTLEAVGHANNPAALAKELERCGLAIPSDSGLAPVEPMSDPPTSRPAPTAIPAVGAGGPSHDPFEEFRKKRS